MNKSNNFYNTGKLVHFFLKRERIIAAVWIAVLVLFSAALAPGLAQMFPDEQARMDVIAIYDNPIMVSMMGPIYGDSTGALYSSMMLLWYIIAVAVMNVFLAIRHTRADEEQGRAEVIRSLPVGRLAGVHAAMLTAVVINAILAVLTGAAMAATRTESMDFAGCMLYGAVAGAVGLVFAAIALVFCQLSQSTSGSAGLSFLTLGVFYMMRAAGDAGSEILSLISPLGLALRSKIFMDNSIVPLLLLLIIASAIAALAYKLNQMRDLGQGFIAAKAGANHAAKSLLSPFGLSLRLLRKMVIIWLIVMLCAGASYGTVIGDIGSYVSNMPQYLEIVGLPPEVIEALSDEEIDGLTEEYADMITEYFGVFITGMMTLIGLIPVLIAGMAIRTEEKQGRLEQVISSSVSKGRYLCGFVVISFAITVLMQLATAVGLYAVAATGDNNPFTLSGLIAAYSAYLPAMWVMLGAAIFLVGAFPKLTSIIWGYYGLVCFLVFVGGMPDVIPQPLTLLSPMKYVPQLPLESVNWGAMTALTLIAAMLTVAGIIAYRRRDMT
jgi:ABC-2 type transport system permease protein